jgi:hypothetical protein
VGQVNAERVVLPFFIMTINCSILSYGLIPD